MNQSSNYQSGSVTQTITIPKSEPKPKSEPEPKSAPRPNHTPFKPYTRQQAAKDASSKSTAERNNAPSRSTLEESDACHEWNKSPRWGDSDSTSEPVSEEPGKEKTSQNPIVSFNVMRSSSSDKSEKKKSTVKTPQELPKPTKSHILRYNASTMGISRRAARADELIDQEINNLLAQRRSGQANVGNLNSVNQGWKTSRLATEETGARSKRCESSNLSTWLSTQKGKRPTSRSNPCVPIRTSGETKAMKQPSVPAVPVVPAVPSLATNSSLSTAIGNVQLYFIL